MLYSLLICVLVQKISGGNHKVFFAPSGEGAKSPEQDGGVFFII